jgi:hypothetical protein
LISSFYDDDDEKPVIVSLDVCSYVLAALTQFERIPLVEWNRYEIRLMAKQMTKGFREVNFTNLKYLLIEPIIL